MGKQFEGVRPASESSIEMEFYYRGVRCRERIRLKPSASNLKLARIRLTVILDAIEKGQFDYSQMFPNSKNATRFSNRASARPETTAPEPDVTPGPSDGT